MTFIFRNMTIFWDIPKWNREQTKWNGESTIFMCVLISITVYLKKNIKIKDG